MSKHFAYSLLMIILTKLNGKPFTLNAMYIEQIQSFPDTTITLTNETKIVVRESEEEVRNKAITFYQSMNIFAVNGGLENE